MMARHPINPTSAVLRLNVGRYAGFAAVVHVAIGLGCGSDSSQSSLPPASLAGAVRIASAQSPNDDPRSRLQVDVRLERQSAGTPYTAPISLATGVPQVLLQAHGVDGESHPVWADVDTGSPAELELHGESVGVARPWIARSLGTFPVQGVFDSTPYRLGVLPSLVVAGWTLAPIPVLVGPNSLAGPPVVGLPLLRRFGGVIFDWEGGTLTLLPPADGRERPACDLPAQLAEAALGEWISVPVRFEDRIVGPGSVPRGSPPADTPAESPHGDGSKGVPQSEAFRLRCMLIDVDIGGRTYSAVVDTGGAGELLAFVPLPSTGEQRALAGSATGHGGSFLVATLAIPLRIGELTFEHVQFGIPDGRAAADLSPYLPELLVGTRLLRRHTLWINFEASTVNFLVPGGLIDGTD